MTGPMTIFARIIDREIPADARRKIGLFCNIRQERVIQAIDVDTTYATPLTYHAENFDVEVLKHFDLPIEEHTGRRRTDVWDRWLSFDPVTMIETHADAWRTLDWLHLECGKRDEFHLQFGLRILREPFTTTLSGKVDRSAHQYDKRNQA